MENVGCHRTSGLVPAVTRPSGPPKCSSWPEDSQSPWPRGAALPKLCLHGAKAEARGSGFLLGPPVPSPPLPCPERKPPRAETHLTHWFIFRPRDCFEKKHQVFLPFVLLENTLN